MYLQNHFFSGSEQRVICKHFIQLFATKEENEIALWPFMNVGWRYEVLTTVWGYNGDTRISHKLFLIPVIGRTFVKPTNKHEGWPIVLIYEEKRQNTEIQQQNLDTVQMYSYSFTSLLKTQCVFCVVTAYKVRLREQRAAHRTEDVKELQGGGDLLPVKNQCNYSIWLSSSQTGSQPC